MRCVSKLWDWMKPQVRLGEGSGTSDQGGAASDGGAKSGEGGDSEAKE